MGSSSSHKQFTVRDPMPQELTNLQNGLYNVMLSGLTPIIGTDWINNKGEGLSSTYYDDSSDSSSSSGSSNKNLPSAIFNDNGSNNSDNGYSSHDYSAKSTSSNSNSSTGNTSASTGSNYADYTTDWWKQQQQLAQDISSNAQNTQNNLISQLSSISTGNQDIINKMLGVIDTGNIPSQLTDTMNKSVNNSLQSSMGSMLSSLGNRGVLNSSITSKGINNLAGNAANAYNQNYLNAFNSVLNGYNQAGQLSQNNMTNAISGINTLGNVPTQAYENLYAPVTPIYNMWKDWYSTYKGSQDYDNYVKEGSGK